MLQSARQFFSLYVRNDGCQTQAQTNKQFQKDSTLAVGMRTSCLSRSSQKNASARADRVNQYPNTMDPFQS